jgi:hypothetical protein
MKVSELLARGKTKLTPETWVKRNPVARPEVCAITAITWPDEEGRFPNSYERGEAVFILGTALKEIAGHHAIASWNDLQTTTLGDVHNLYDRAIRIAESKEVQKPSA